MITTKGHVGTSKLHHASKQGKGVAGATACSVLVTLDVTSLVTQFLATQSTMVAHHTNVKYIHICSYWKTHGNFEGGQGAGRGLGDGVGVVRLPL